MNQISIDKFLTQAEIKRAAALYVKLKDTGRFAATLDEEIITPNIERINKALGQENYPRFLAYAIEYVLMNSEVKR